MRRLTRVVAVVIALGFTAALISCAPGGSPSSSEDTLTIAAVDNPDIERLRELSQNFSDQNNGVNIEWVQQDENEIRQTISTDVSTEGGRFDVVTVGPYATPIWGEKDFLVPMEDMPAGFNADDFMPSIREALSHKGTLYAAPFYGESSFTMYRTDLFEQAGLEMPQRPTWDFIIGAASTVSARTDVANGICLRGKAGWGENMGFITAMANSYGARWFNEEWIAQLDSEEWSNTINDYLELGEYAPSDAPNNGYSENLNLFQNGKCAIWVDATVAASSVTDPDQSRVADSVGFAFAPGTGLDKQSNWLWSWALAVPKGSGNKDLAKEFITWATSEEYLELAAEEYGWANVPPGARRGLYDNSNYTEAAPFADLTLESIESANPEDPTVQPVPYEGIQYVDVPGFQSIGTAVGDQMSDALAGDIGANEALENSQWVTNRVIERTRLLDEKQQNEGPAPSDNPPGD
ncbi:MAG: ABC transporter substrate-binding protein [Rubrobacteraceae bacterium]